MKTEQLEKLLKSTILEDNLIGFNLLKDCNTLEDILIMCPYAESARSSHWPGLTIRITYRKREEIYYRINERILAYTGITRLIFRDTSLIYNDDVEIKNL